jgi:tetratricopeptide (TPR) repeat protein
MVYPGAESTVTLRILVARRRNKQALELFENGIEYYIKGGEGNYRRAEELFGKALEQDAAYSEAALYLARTYNALFDQEKAKEYFQRSVEIDPDYVEARASYGGMLLDIGDTDLAIRQLDAVIRREPRHTQAQYLLAEAFRLKGAYNESIESARRADRNIAGQCRSPILACGESETAGLQVRSAAARSMKRKRSISSISG